MRKKYYLIMALVLVTPFMLAIQRTRSGGPIQPTGLDTPMVLWEQIGTTPITVAQTSPAVTARDYSEVWALAATKTITWEVPNDVSGIELRFETTADADATVAEIWLAAGETMRDGTTESQFTLGSILTLTGGKQTGTVANVFVDTMVEDGNGVMTDFTVVDSATDRIAIYRGDLRGYKRVVIIATTLEGSSTLYAHMRWF